MLAIVRLLVHLGMQSLRAHKTKSLIVGGLMAFGAFLVVTSLALVDSIERATRASVVQSVAGDFQVYSKSAEDKFALFGAIGGFGSEELGEVEHYRKLEQVIESVDNVAAAVPVGITNAAVSSPGDLDRALVGLRDAVAAGQPTTSDEVKALIERTRSIVAVLTEQQQKQSSVSADASPETKEILARAASPALWAEFEASPVPTLDWLDTKLAPLGEQANQFYLRMVGTDLVDFGKAFPRIKVVEGELVPANTRGVLIGRGFLDLRLKLGVAMNLDTISRERTRGDTLAGSTTLRETLGKAQRAAVRLAYLIPPRSLPAVTDAFAKETGLVPTTPFQELTKAFFAIDDANFDRRYKIFYDVVAPVVQLYPFRVGDTITLTSFSKSGYLRSINVKDYGIYSIEGLEGAGLADTLTLTDLVTFRELYGQRTAALDDELKKMKASVGATEVAREDAEAALFGGDDTVDVKVVEGITNGDAAIERVERKELTTFDQAAVNEGMVISSAVLLKDPSKERQTQAALLAAVEPLGMQVADWQQATGVIGQMTLVVRGVLLAAIVILFLVTIVILNNALVMATLERVSEFGTLRAIGAQKGFVNAMVVFETAVLGVIAGAVGAGGGVALISYLGAKGIPAPVDILQVMFGGSHLYPSVTVSNIVAGLFATLVVAVFATLYPARLATSVQPVVAMQGKE